MKRVYTLYRVSTKGQVDKDDIPLQKRACREFAENRSDWEITREFSEKGVSGYKVSANDRDAIQDILKAAADGKFDVLLVFKFDRLGRRHDETPFVVEGIARMGIEVWSVTEGQQRFENQVDSLINFITFWQANTESKNTSIRIKTRMKQLAEEGRYTGGAPPYGYTLVKCGTNKKGHDIHNLAVEESEASVVKMIFDLYVNHGLGAYRIAAYLAEHGIVSRTGKDFLDSTIRRMLHRELFIGFLGRGESRSDRIDSLRIVGDDIFHKAQAISKQRQDVIVGSMESTFPRVVMGRSLLSGNIFCGVCGGRMSATTSTKKYNRKDGSTEIRTYPRYLCYNRTHRNGLCDGKSSHRAKIIDEVVESVVRCYFTKMGSIPMSDIIGSQYEKEQSELKSRLSAAQKEVTKLEGDIAALKGEVASVVRGNSRFTPELLTESIGILTDNLNSARKLVAALAAECENKEALAKSLKSDCERIFTYAEIFEESGVDVKKMVVANLIERVTVTADSIDIKWKITAQQYGIREVESVTMSDKKANRPA
jgi:DNA invertase Pin-like site-specific DNA recombinase